MAQSVAVIVRARPGNHSLEGALRVHLAPETLELAGLKLGDLCQINSEDGTTLGYGIAWRADDNMRTSKASERPAKMSEMLREALKVDENQHVQLTRATVGRFHAGKVFLRDVTPNEYSKAGASSGDDLWRKRADLALGVCEGFMQGMTFDVTGAKKTSKRRFKIERIQTSGSNGALCYCNDSTEVSIDDSNSPVQDVIPTAANSGHLLDPSHIGGLLNEVTALNQRMKWLLKDAQDTRADLLGHDINQGILLHGFEGTGKTHIMEQLAKTPFRSVKCLKAADLTGASVSKTIQHIQDTFHHAESSQPSLIVIDDVSKLLEGAKQAYTETLIEHMRRVVGSRVLVIASCRRPADLDSQLTAPGLLSHHLELSIPDRFARSEILEILLQGVEVEAGAIESAAFASHGYTGRDLHQAVVNAKMRAQDRFDLDQDMQEASSNGAQQAESDAVQANGQHGAALGACNSSAVLLTEDLLSTIKHVRPTALREITFQPPNIGWSDIGGSTTIKSRFDKTLGWTVHHPDVLKSYNRNPPKGVLLYGPPGCSKTLTAQAVASHYGLNFLPVKGGELISMYVGESERAIRELFRKARQAAPCVIFFDEIDSIASERETGSSKGLNVLTTLLNEMDGFEKLDGVFILAATNKPEVLDPAIMRAGRLGTHVYLGPPSAVARNEILNINLDKVPTEDGLELNRLVEMSEGRSGAEIVQICELAIDRAIERKIDGGDGKVRMVDLEDAIKSTKSSITAEMLEAYKAFAAT